MNECSITDELLHYDEEYDEMVEDTILWILYHDDVRATD